MKKNYKKKPKKCLGYLMALAMMFSFSGNSVAQSLPPPPCGEIDTANQVNTSCYGMTGAPPSPNTPDGSIDVSAVGGTGYYHYILEIFLPSTSIWMSQGNFPNSGFPLFTPLYTALPGNFSAMSADSFRVRTVEGVSSNGPATNCGDTVYLMITEPPAIVVTETIINASHIISNYQIIDSC